MSKFYLYAAAVQGIQDFIFKTNELRHIVGASELVEQICTTAFDEFGEKNGKSIVRAAGNIKHIFTDENVCKDAYLKFPRKIMIMAPGITISQAVYCFDDESNFGVAVNKVEELLKTQRNKPPKSVLLGLMGIKRANNTGLPVTKLIKDSDGNSIYLDDTTFAKLAECNIIGKLCKKSFGEENFNGKLPKDISEITGKNDWIAIVHADGNGLGKVVQKIGKNKETFREFSQKLDEATTLAANAAYDAVKSKFDEEKKIPIRPVVLSGDDMTVIIRGDLAIEYAKVFIQEFENKTREKLGSILKPENLKPEKAKPIFSNGKDFLTACAGVAFIKSSYPFYYGYLLAEELCGQAKKDTKALTGKDALPASCLMFHKVQDSFITNYEAIVERELTVPTDSLSNTEQSKGNPLFKAGPYYIETQTGKYTVDELEKYSKQLDGESENGVKSGIRNWITLRLENKEKAEQRKKRMLQLFQETDKENTDYYTIVDLTNETGGTCIAYDVLAYHTIMNQETNNK